MKRYYLIILLVLLTLTTGCASRSRAFKDIKSDIQGGIPRVIYVHDYTGNLLYKYEGQIDIIADSTDGRIIFEVDNKRIILYNAIVITEEL